MTQDRSEPRTAILLSALEDWVSLCEVIGHVDHAHPGAGAPELRKLTLEVLTGLMREGLLVPGETGSCFMPWSIGTEEAIAIVSAEWAIPVLEIDPGHGWWFDLTDLGEDVAEALEEQRRRGSGAEN